MNAHKKSLTLFAGLLLFSGWSLQASRLLIPGAHLPQVIHRAALPAKAAPTAQQKVELEQRLSTVVRDPKQIKKDDVKAVQSTFGSDAAKLLQLLRESAD